MSDTSDEQAQMAQQQALASVFRDPLFMESRNHGIAFAQLEDRNLLRLDLAEVRGRKIGIVLDILLTVFFVIPFQIAVVLCRIVLILLKNIDGVMSFVFSFWLAGFVSFILYMCAITFW